MFYTLLTKAIGHKKKNGTTVTAETAINDLENSVGQLNDSLTHKSMPLTPSAIDGITNYSHADTVGGLMIINVLISVSKNITVNSNQVILTLPHKGYAQGVLIRHGTSTDACWIRINNNVVEFASGLTINGGTYIGQIISPILD